MDEYIKREDVKKAIHCKGENLIFNKGRLFIPFRVVRSAIENAPTADVVPKSEVERLQEDVDRLQEINNRQVENIKLAEQRVAREIFAEIELKLSENDSFEITSDGKGLDYFDAKLAEEISELKKKYTEV